MKKTLTTAALSSVLILGMASAAMAVHITEPAETAVSSAGAAKVTIDGALRMRGALETNGKSVDYQDSKAYYDTRIRLGVKAVVAPGAIGYVELETAKNGGDTVKWGAADGGASLNSGGTKSIGELNVLQAWINYQPSNWGVKVGHMPLALGNNLFFDHTGSGDDAVVAYINPSDSTHVAGIAIKFLDNQPSSDDLNGYVGLITQKLSDSLTLGANWTYLTQSTWEMSFSNIGLTVDGKAGAISYSADLEYQLGDLGTTVEASGYAIRLAGSMDLGAAKAGLVFGYGSGDDGTDATENDAFVNYLTDTNYDTLIGSYRINIPGTGVQNSGLTNLSLYQINGSTGFTCPMTGKDVDMKGSLSYMALNEELTPLTGGYGTIGTAGAQDDSDVGTEIDLVTTWHLTAGLDYKVEAAYLFVGDVFNTSTTSDPDNIFFLRHRLELKF